ncbi:GH1 family beta-glucosidase [Nocardioides mesophilus]|uniref:Beta-glucosidase n=1 Tax=Nocardioides mesophilus TaxID=433659 RepID=A0A7G9RF39_9ACTN|nr:GH1 family beta-glucosidase [Nocardioides mesophilus]QNN54214.1 beta-glucosidase [Nocardioides mesophilus]
MTSHLPDGSRLAFGTATASYQIEGAATADGKGPSIWDTFTAVPGTIVDGSDGTAACDSYVRYEEDADLVKGLGVDYYRFSFAWPRIMPTGSGAVEPRGLAYYDRVVDALLERQITPMATLYHWDLPQALQDADGWLNRDTAERFADYAMVLHEHFADRVHLWATHNEPWCAAYLGYGSGRHAPGRRDGGGAHRAAHHLMLGHGLAAGRMHEAGADAVGIVLNLSPVWPERPEAAEAADGVDAIRNRVWLDPLVDGAYDENLLRIAPVLRDPDVVRDGDLELIRGSADWVGVNYYTPARVDVPDEGQSAVQSYDDAGDAEVDAFPGVENLTFTPRDPRTDIGWEIEPGGLEELLVTTHERTGLPLIVTENGAAFPDTERTPDGTVDDQDRIDYVRSHIEAVDRAREAGADVRAYVLWTLLDNFEWAEGYTKTFGIVHVDRTDLSRTPKRSYEWYSKLVHDRTS